jgi:hypothetical protein
MRHFMSRICDGSYFPPPCSDNLTNTEQPDEPCAAARLASGSLSLLTGEKLNRDILRIGNETRFVLIWEVIQISLEAAPDEKQ